MCFPFFLLELEILSPHFSLYLTRNFIFQLPLQLEVIMRLSFLFSSFSFFFFAKRMRVEVTYAISELIPQKEMDSSLLHHQYGHSSS